MKSLVDNQELLPDGPNPETIRSAGFGMCVSLIVHAGILIILSLIVLTTSADSPLEMLVEFGDEGTEEESSTLEQVAELKLMDPAEEQPIVPLNLPVDDLPEPVPDPGSIIDSLSGDVPIDVPGSVSDEGTGGTVDPVVARMISDRVQQAGGRRGEVQFSLAWKNVNDLDLHIVAPSGQHIWWLEKESACRGMLDVDMNVNGESKTPVENTRWLSNAPAGRYTVIVHLFGINNNQFRPTDFQLLARLGRESELVTEQVSGRERLIVSRFIYPGRVTGSKRQSVIRRWKQRQQTEEKLASAILTRAIDSQGERQRTLLQSIIQKYPHTDASIEARSLLKSSLGKD